MAPWAALADDDPIDIDWPIINTMTILPKTNNAVKIFVAFLARRSGE